MDNNQQPDTIDDDDHRDRFADVELIAVMKTLGFELSHHEGITDWFTKDEGTSELTVFGAQDLVAALSAMVEGLISDAEPPKKVETSPWALGYNRCSTEYSNELRQRAIAKGFTMKGGE